MTVQMYIRNFISTTVIYYFCSFIAIFTLLTVWQFQAVPVADFLAEITLFPTVFLAMSVLLLQQLHNTFFFVSAQNDAHYILSTQETFWSHFPMHMNF